MSANPREQFIHIGDAIAPDGVATFQDKYDDSRSCNYSSVDVKCSYDRYNSETEDNFAKIVYFSPYCICILDMRYKNTRRFYVQTIIMKKYIQRVVQYLVSYQIVKIEHNGTYWFGLFQHQCYILVVHLISFLPVHKHRHVIPAEIYHIFILVAVIFAYYYRALCTAHYCFVLLQGQRCPLGVVALIYEVQTVVFDIYVVLLQAE